MTTLTDRIKILEERNYTLSQEIKMNLELINALRVKAAHSLVS